MRIRLRGPAGASTITLGEDATVGDLLSLVTEKTSLTKFDIKYSYPPKLLHLGHDSTLLSSLDVHLDGEQLTVGAQDVPTIERSKGQSNIQHNSKPTVTSLAEYGKSSQTSNVVSFAGMPAEKMLDQSTSATVKSSDPVSLTRKAMDGDVPELPMPDRGATMLLRVMPDDNSCLFRAFGTAVLPGDELTMTELRSLVASTIQREPEVYTAVVLEQTPDDYCRWIQTEDAWGGAIEMTILSKHFEIELCSIDVQSLRIDRFNEGASMKCIIVYSGIHYDTIVQSPSEPPHEKADSPPDFDKRIWDHEDDDILVKAQELCKKLQAKHYFTDTGGMTIKCNECGWIGYGESQAAGHAQQRGHYDMGEIKS